MIISSQEEAARTLMRKLGLAHIEDGPMEKMLRETRVFSDESGSSLLAILPAHMGALQGSVLLGGGSPALLSEVCAQLDGEQNAFVLAAPRNEQAARRLADAGFDKTLYCRRVRRPVRRNIWAQAEFDAVTARQLQELREKFAAHAVLLPLPAVIAQLSELYIQGLTIVSNEGGYGLYFVHKDTLCFIELQAEGERAAEILLEAAREKEVLVENAEICVMECQDTLFLGEGKKEALALLRSGKAALPAEDEIYFYPMLPVE